MCFRPFVLVIISLVGALVIAGCPEESATDRVASLMVVPKLGFTPAFGVKARITHVESSKDPFQNGSFVMEGEAPVGQFRMLIVNDASGPENDVQSLTLVVYVNKRANIVLARLADVAFLGATFVLPTPARLTETEWIHDDGTDPFPGHHSFIALGQLAAGQSFEFEALVAAAPGTEIHFEAVGELSGGRWALTEPTLGTTVTLPAETPSE